MLGPPDGGSPACNRALVINGQRSTWPSRPGTTTSMRRADRSRASIAPRSTSRPGTSLAGHAAGPVARPQLLPAGVVSGDFHVHGGASFDSSIPDLDRVVSFLATGVDVIIATDHNVVTNYASTLATLGATNSIIVIPGVEQTPNILWYYVPGDTFPKTLGHFNFWPLVPDFLADAQRRALVGAARARPVDGRHGRRCLRQRPATGVRQLNHPYLLAKLGRDQGYPQAIGYDPTTPIPATPTDGFTFAANALARTPGGERTTATSTGTSRR